MLIQSLRPQTFSQVVGNQLNNKILMTLAKDPTKGPSTLIFQGSFGSGKAIDVNSILPTPDGYKKAKDINVGNHLFNRHGKSTTVIAVYPQGEKESYKVTFEDGRVVHCCAEHNWTLIDKKTGLLNEMPVTLQEIIDQKIEAIIPVAEPVEYPNYVQYFNIPPYILGLLLVNSVSEKTTVVYNDKSTINILQQNLKWASWEQNLINSCFIPFDSDHKIIPDSVFYGEFKEEIEEHKIPIKYLTSTISNRLELLQAIMDCCGTVSNDNNVFCEIKNKNLKDSVLNLAYSLGLVVSVSQGLDGYLLYFKTNKAIRESLFKYKKIETGNIQNNSNIDPYTMSIISIEKDPEQREMVCFTVSDDTNECLYLCNDFIVTHNTTSSRLFAKALNCKHLKENDICGKCEICKADLNNVPWYTEFDSSAMGNVDSIRDLRDVFSTTAKGYNRVITLDECHLLSRVAQAALLKIFEETPKGVFFILPTTDPDKLLPTIRSRSLELIYTAKSTKEVRDNIEKHANSLGLNLSSSTIDLIVTRSRGIMRNAHMLLDKVNLIGEEEFLKSDLPTTSLISDFIKAILKTDRSAVLETVSELSRIPVAYLRDDWQDYFLNLMRASIDPELVQDERIKKIATYLGKQMVVQIAKFCIQDWVIKSFQNSTQSQIAMLAIYQSLSKEAK